MKLKFTLLFLFAISFVQGFSQDNKVFAITGQAKANFNWTDIRVIDVNTGNMSKTLYENGKSKFSFLDAETNKVPDIAMNNNAVATLDRNLAGSVNNIVIDQSTPTAAMSAAAAYDKRHDKLFFSSMRTGQLMWLDTKQANGTSAFYTVKQPLIINKNFTDEALNITRMTIGEKAVIGLATGSTPKSLYAELVKMHREEGLSFKNVITFNLDQYYPMEPDALNSYHYFMRKYLFEQTDIDPENYFLPNGLIPKERIKEHCAEYENKIEEAGGLDIQILGIGNNGHIGFNEPGSPVYSKTRLITLDNSTRLANSHEFGNISDVPRMAITMGISTILKSRRIILLAWGKPKAPVIQKAVEGKPTEEIPASLLQNHDDCQFVLDEFAASELTRFKSPWLTGDCEWTPNMIKRAVINLSLKLDKPVLSLTDHDYNEFGLSDIQRRR